MRQPFKFLKPELKPSKKCVILNGIAFISNTYEINDVSMERFLPLPLEQYYRKVTILHASEITHTPFNDNTIYSFRIVTYLTTDGDTIKEKIYEDHPLWKRSFAIHLKDTT